MEYFFFYSNETSPGFGRKKFDAPDMATAEASARVTLEQLERIQGKQGWYGYLIASELLVKVELRK